MGGLDPSEEAASGEAGLADDELRRGATLGRYTVLRPVGSGGAGQVYAAYDPHLDRKVALKFLHVAGGRDSSRARARMLREAKSLAKLSHPNVVAVHDAGTLEGRLFIAMEFVDGQTLGDWLAERPRTRPEILEVFASAGRGLAAAHAAGLVHRDFKPANVMIGKNGSVRVTDFGLARVVTEPDDLDASSGAYVPRDPRLTSTGELLGTPLYMAPEQLMAHTTDARTDQFSFCVALYRALYGVAPFGTGSLQALTASVLRGRVEPPPPKTTVPAWLRRVLVRGLSVDPDARWPSLLDLVAALGRDPARTRRRWGIAAGALSLVALSAAAIASHAERPAQLCLGGPGRLAGVWESAETSPELHPRRDAIEKAFLASGTPGAAEVWQRVAALLDRYRSGWLAMYRDACEATQLRAEQTAAVMELRMSCLEERRLALAALTTVFATADRDTVKSAVNATNALPTFDRCADRRQLEAAIELPRDEVTRKRVDDLRARAAMTKALDDTGKHQEAKTLARAQLAEARALGYRPLVAEALMALGRTFTVNYQAETVAIDEETLWTSLAAGRDDLATEAAVALTGWVGCRLARFDEGRSWAKLANALLDRSGDGHEILRSWLFTNEANIAAYQHRSEQALDLNLRALAIKEKVLPPDHPDIAATLLNEANVLAQLGRNDEALQTNDRAYDLYVRAYGPASAEASSSLSNHGEFLIALGRPAEALEPLQRALAGWEAQIGADHQFLGYPLTALGRAFLALGRPAEALPPLERARRLHEAHEDDPLALAETRFALARALWDATADRARARALAQKARAVYAEAADDKETASVATWLAAHTAESQRSH